MEDDIMEAADLAANIPQDKSSAVYRKLNPDVWRWSEAEHLAAHQVDLLRWLHWSKTRDASKRPPRNMPKPIPRPGITDKQTEAQGRFKDVQAMPLSELKRQLSLPRQPSKG